MTPADLIAGARTLISSLRAQPLYQATGEWSELPDDAADTIRALLDDRDELTQRIEALETEIANPKQQASSPQLSLGREFVLHYLNERGPSSRWPICQSAEVDGIGRGMEWADKHLRWLRMSGLAARTGRKDSFGRSIHQITEAGRARLQADEVAQ